MSFNPYIRHFVSPEQVKKIIEFQYDSTVFGEPDEPVNSNQSPEEKKLIFESFHTIFISHM